nr:hypothetical transcript [Hymenolepis microstoma]
MSTRRKSLRRRRFPIPSTSKSHPPRAEIEEASKGCSEVTKRSSLLMNVLDHYDIIDSHGDEITNGDAYLCLPFWELF